MIAYVTDLEGRWDKLTTFVAGNPHVSLVDGALVLAEGVTFERRTSDARARRLRNARRAS